MADVITGATEVANLTMQNVSEIAQLYLQQESKMLPLVTDYSSLAVPGASSIALPRLSGFTPVKKVENTAVDAQTITGARDVITFTEPTVVQFLVEDTASQNSRIDLIQNYLLRASKDLALAMDNQIIAQLRLASASAPDHEISFVDTTNEDIELADILAARRLLIAQNINPQECYMAIGPDQERNLLNISDLIHAEKYGSSLGLVRGEIGMIYGLRVVVHTSLSQEALFWHPTAVGYAFASRLKVERDRDLPNMADRFSVSYRMDAQVLDGGKRNVHITETP